MITSRLRPLLLASLLGAALIASPVAAQESTPSARELSSQLAAGIQDGASTVRLKIEFRAAATAPKSVLQLAVKSLRTEATTKLTYQVLWPKERKGEGFTLNRSDDSPVTGAVFTPPDSLRPLPPPPAGWQEPVFGSDLSYEDLLDNFFAWEHQSITGTETIDRLPCLILESKPGKNQRSSYSAVRSWIDPKKLVPMRIEKLLASGQVARRIVTTRVAKDDTGRPVASSFSVSRPGHDSLTELEGSSSRHEVTLSEADFTPEALRSPTAKTR
jgi:hypothetical protein